MEQYKLIQYVQNLSEGELYDLRADPSEHNNLYGKPEYAALQTHLTERLNVLCAKIPERKGSKLVRFAVGCLPGIRTPIDRFRADCPTIERGGNRLNDAEPQYGSLLASTLLSVRLSSGSVKQDTA